MRKWLMAKWVACGVVGTLLPVGCGAAPEEPHFAQNEVEQIAIKEPPPSVEVPETTVRKMTACVEQMSPPTAAPSVAFQYNLGANERGKVVSVELHDATERVTALEACFRQASKRWSCPTTPCDCGHRSHFREANACTRRVAKSVSSRQLSLRLPLHPLLFLHWV